MDATNIKGERRCQRSVVPRSAPRSAFAQALGRVAGRHLHFCACCRVPSVTIETLVSSRLAAFHRYRRPVRTRLLYERLAHSCCAMIHPIAKLHNRTIMFLTECPGVDHSEFSPRVRVSYLKSELHRGAAAWPVNHRLSITFAFAVSLTRLFG